MFYIRAPTFAIMIVANAGAIYDCSDNKLVLVLCSNFYCSDNTNIASFDN